MNKIAILLLLILSGLLAGAARITAQSQTVEPSLSPAFFTDHLSKNRNLSALDTPLGELTRITQSPEGRTNRAPNISGDGARIVFTSDSDLLNQGIPEGQSEIWLYEVATGSLERITVASSSERSSVTPSLSYDGSKVVFSSDADFLGQGIVDDQFEVWLYDLATQQLSRITTASSADRDSFSPVIDSNGDKIAFSSDSDFLGQSIPAGQRELWTYDLTSQSFSRLTAASSPDRVSVSPSISADGSRIAFVSTSDFHDEGVPGDTPQVWLHETTAETLTRVSTGADDYLSYGADISGDGGTIVFHSNGSFDEDEPPTGAHEIWSFDVATSQHERLTDAPYSILDSYAPSVNADGSRVVFHSRLNIHDPDLSSEIEIWLYDFPSGAFVKLSTASAAGRNSIEAAMDASGTKVVFISDSDMLDEGIEDDQNEVWLNEGPFTTHDILQVGAFPNRQMRLQWEDIFTNESNFVIERAPGALAPGAFSVIATLPADTNVFTDTVPVSEETYWYRVKADNNGQGLYSNQSYNASFDRAPNNDEQYLLVLINEARADPGEFGYPEIAPVPPLAYSPLLNFAARSHSQAILNSGFQIGHCDLIGRCPTERAQAVGYVGGVGENLIAGMTGPEWVESSHQAFMDSEGHRNNVMLADYTDAGIGHTYDPSKGGDSYWKGQYTEKFGILWEDAPPRPNLPSGIVVPYQGSASTDFTYIVNYYHAAGHAPGDPLVYIDGVPHAMNLSSGKPHHGTYRYTTRLRAGQHEYCFYFTFPGGAAQLPAAGAMEPANALSELDPASPLDDHILYLPITTKPLPPCATGWLGPTVND